MAQRIALGLTKDTQRAELLTEKAAQMAKYGESGITFEIGGVAVDETKVTEHLKAAYPFLVDGSGATGSGAKGGATTAPPADSGNLESMYREAGFQ